MSDPFTDLGEAIADERFVDIDLALRRGQHIDRDDADWYGYLLDARVVLEPFYRRYGCELIHRSDGYFFLLPSGEKVSKRLLGLPEMVVGQGAALLYLDPATVESGGLVTRDDLVSHLAAVMGTDALVSVFNPKRKRLDERVAQEVVRQRVGEGLRKLAQLGFLTLSEDNRIHLRSALLRFADPVRGAGSPRDALEKLIARGEVSIPSEQLPDDEAAANGPSEDGLEPDDELLENSPEAATDLAAVPPEDDLDSSPPTAALPIALPDEEDQFDFDAYSTGEDDFDDPYAQYAVSAEEDVEASEPALDDLLGETDEDSLLGVESGSHPSSKPKKSH